MKIVILLSILLAYGCNTEESNDSGKINKITDIQNNGLSKAQISYKIIEGACGDIILTDSTYNAFEESLAALEGKYNNNNVLPSNYAIEKILFEIDFSEDSREFYGIKFVNSQGVKSTVGLSDVIDTQGYQYKILWCED